MKIQFNITKIIEKSDDLNFLDDVRRSQLRIALNRYFGSDTSNVEDLFSKNACISLFMQAVDTNSSDKVLYDFWEVNFDSGTLFLPNSLELAGLRKLQNSFCLDEGFSGKELEELASKLNIAKKVKASEPMKVILNKDNEIVEFKDVRDVPEKATNWTKFLKDHKLSQDLVNQYRSVFNDASWRLILSQTKLNDTFLESLATDIGWKLVSEYQYLSETFIQQHQQFLDWKVLSYKQRFNEAQIIEYQDRLDWPAVSWSQTLSPGLISQFSDKLNWESVCMYQKLDLDSIKRNLDKFSKSAWQNISQKQMLSKELLDAFPEKIDWGYASMNLHLTDAQLVEYAGKIKWNRLINYGRNLSYSTILHLISNNSLAFDDIEDIVNERKKFELSDQQVKELKKLIKDLKKKK